MTNMMIEDTDADQGAMKEETSITETDIETNMKVVDTAGTETGEVENVMRGDMAAERGTGVEVETDMREGAENVAGRDMEVEREVEVTLLAKKGEQKKDPSQENLVKVRRDLLLQHLTQRRLMMMVRMLTKLRKRGKSPG